MRLHFKRVNLDSPKYKPSSYPRVKCTPCLLSLGLATGAASSACRFLQKDWAPLRTGLLLMPFVTMTESQMHTRTHAHTHTHTDLSWGMLESRALLNYSSVIPLLRPHSTVSYLWRPGRLCESVTALAGYELVDLRFLKRIYS